MSFVNLSSDLQNIMLVQYNMFFKGFLFFGALLFAIVYLFYWKKEKEVPTVFYSVGILRSLLTILSWLHLLLSPLSLFLLNPEYTLANATVAFYPVYLTFLSIGAITLMVDLFYYMPTVLLRMAGLDMGDPKIKKVHMKVQRYFKKNG